MTVPFRSEDDSWRPFVILRHETTAGSERPSHWDWMFQEGEALVTWAAEVWPQAGQPVVARHLPDHRLAYLDYEGPVSGNRGHVVRVDRGQYRIADRSASSMPLTLIVRSERLSGTLLLSRDEAEPRWRMVYEPDGSAAGVPSGLGLVVPEM
jgi:hypothetical protein